MTEALHSKLDELLASSDASGETLNTANEVIGRLLHADRCCLFLRHPVSRVSRMTHEWVAPTGRALQRDSDIWEVEPESLPTDDPMFAEALANPEALYIEDIRSADPALVNAEYEEAHFGHRALIHAPLYHEEGMYGILEPCVFAGPRVWSATDRALVEKVQKPLAALAAAYVREQVRD